MTTIITNEIETEDFDALATQIHDYLVIREQLAAGDIAFIDDAFIVENCQLEDPDVDTEFQIGMMMTILKSIQSPDSVEDAAGLLLQKKLDVRAMHYIAFLRYASSCK